MRLSTWALSAVLLLAEVVSAKAISYRPRILQRAHDLDGLARRAIAELEGAAERRNVDMTNIGRRSSLDDTVKSACSSTISNMTSLANAAGFAGCYNILTWDSKTATFQADLRLYRPGKPSGSFANVSNDQIAVLLNYAETTQFSSLATRSLESLDRRDDSTQEIRRYTMSGGLKKGFDMSKLNDTMLASLLVPQITLKDLTSNAVSNMSATDTAWFVAGQFTGVSAQAVQVANPAMAVAATTAAKGFVLPGTTLGIFPTGLIVTSVWTLFFFIAFGLGTFGRMKSRDVYRKRVVIGGGMPGGGPRRI